MPLPVLAGVGAGAAAGGSPQVRSGEAGATWWVTGVLRGARGEADAPTWSPGGWGAGRATESRPPLRRIPCGWACARVKGVDGREGCHHDEAAGAALGAGVARRAFVAAVRVLGRGGLRRCAQEGPDVRQGRGAPAVAEHPVVADVLEAPGEAVEQEAPQELDDVERHGTRAVPVGVVLPSKADPAVGDGHEALAADGDPVGVARPPLLPLP